MESQVSYHIRQVILVYASMYDVFRRVFGWKIDSNEYVFIDNMVKLHIMDTIYACHGWSIMAWPYIRTPVFLKN